MDRSLPFGGSCFYFSILLTYFLYSLKRSTSNLRYYLVTTCTKNNFKLKDLQLHRELEVAPGLLVVALQLEDLAIVVVFID